METTFPQTDGQTAMLKPVYPHIFVGGGITISRVFNFKEIKREKGIRFLPTVCSAIASACALSSSSILMSGIRASLTAGATTSVSSCQKLQETSI